MTTFGMDVDAYARRIGYDGERAPSPGALRAIVRAHAMAIPFENLSVLASGAPDLGLEALEAKLVHNARGGYCFEQNGLLLGALRALGFDVTPLSARVRYATPPEVVTPHSHMVLCVATPHGRMLVDAGFGGLTPTAPVRLDTREAQSTPHEDVRLVPHDGGFVLQASLAQEWRDLYAFDMVAQHPVDYLQQNWYTATRPGALFANNLVVARPTPDGRHTLFNRRHTWRERSGATRETVVESVDALRGVLDSVFAIRPSNAELAAAWEVSGHGPPSHPMFA